MNDLTDFSKPEAWKAEIDRSRRLAELHWPDWQTNLEYYIGQSPDAASANNAGNDYVNVNADFTNVEVKLKQLFFSSPELQLAARGQFKQKPQPAPAVQGMPAPPPMDPMAIIAAHRALLNVLLGDEEADALSTTHKAIKDCLLTAGVGATKICYEAATNDVMPPDQLGNVLNLQTPVSVPIAEQYKWFRIPSKKFRAPADFFDTDFDKSPWLAMDFRMPRSQAERQFDIPPDFMGTKDRDERVLEADSRDNREASALPYVDGTEIWYYASIFDPDAVNPFLIRRHVLIEGVDGFVEKDPTNPYQELLPNGRLSGDSMIGYPIHVLAIRDVPDSAFVPSDSTMTRPLVRELCNFRTQQVRERDANLPRIAYDSEKITPEVIAKIESGALGALIPVPADALAGGIERVMAQITQGNQTRGSYAANDYIQRDLDKTLGIDALGSGIKDQQSATATEINVVDRQRNVRLDGERLAVLKWYIKGIRKFSALVCRYTTPELATAMIGDQAAGVWGQWDKKQWDGRFVFSAKPDSQIKLDAAAERKFHLDVYQFTAKDPNVNRIPTLKKIAELGGYDPTEFVVEQLPDQPPTKPTVGLAIKGEDFIGPQSQAIFEILGQLGIEISEEARQTVASQLFQQMQLGIRDASGAPVKATPTKAEHGGVADKVRPLSKTSADAGPEQGRSGPPAK